MMENVKRKLFDKLKAFNSNKDFVFSVITYAGTDENYQQIIDFMDKGEGVTVDSILTLAALLDDMTKHETTHYKL